MQQNFALDLHLQTIIAPSVQKGISIVQTQILNLQPKLLENSSNFVNSDAGHNDCSGSEKRPDHLNIDADMLKMEKISEILASLKFADSRNPSPTHSEYNSEIDDHRESASSQPKLKRCHSSNTVNEEESMSDMGDLPCSSQSSDSENRPEVMEDDEWLDSGKNELLSPDNSGRKKAPSGTACDRHKRWKKRCPDDCPFRSQRQKKLFAIQKSDSQEELFADPAEQLVRITDQLISKLQGDEWEKTSLKLYRLICKLKESQIIGSLDMIEISKEPTTKTECLELVAMVMKQIQENIEVPVNHNSKRLTTSSSYEDLSGSDFIFYDEELDEFSSKKGKRRSVEISDDFFDTSIIKRGNSYTIACEYHNSLHARCPSNCPDRRPSKIRSDKVKDTVESKRYKKSSDESSSGSDSDSKPRDSIKKKKTSKKGLNSRVGRKYLPQACERHKLLHARCPANCPDRMARDTQKTQNQIGAI